MRKRSANVASAKDLRESEAAAATATARCWSLSRFHRTWRS
ncbi:hypothetical protein [Lysinibacillus sphaericus]|nr:hypothetical protein [Lysinibacillus sphaericus]